MNRKQCRFEDNQMTKNDFIKSHRAAGWLPQQEAAIKVGRKAGGNIPKLMARHGVRTVRHKNVNLYLEEDLARVPVLGHSRGIRDDYIDKQTKPRQVDWLESQPNGVPPPAQTEKTLGERLTGISADMWTIVGYKQRIIFNCRGRYALSMTTEYLIEISRAIVARIDGDKVGRLEKELAELKAAIRDIAKEVGE
jgi:hypothetical protein